MIVRRTAAGVEVWTPAKLNLFLEVLHLRDDGFHEIETLLVPIRLFDTIVLRAANRESTSIGRLGLQCVGHTDGMPAAGENLVLRALELLRHRAGIEAGAHVRLTKRIPIAAGLGGGSSDAAAALVAGSLAWGVDYSRSRLMELAAEIGSDVPFFLADNPAVCRGRGERIETIPRASMPHFVVACPEEPVSTAEVYRRCRPAAAGEHVRDGRPVLAALQQGIHASLGARLYNRLQQAAMEYCPAVGRLSGLFSKLNLYGHQMSGSGGACFGVCRSARHARRAAAVLTSQGAGRVCAVTGA